MSKVEVWVQELADKVLHELPEELAVGLVFRLHDGGDALVMLYPASLEGTPEFKELDTTVRRFGGAWVSRGAGKSYYLIPRPKPAAVQPEAVKLPQPVPVKFVSADPKPAEVQKGIVKGSDVAAAKARIPGVASSTSTAPTAQSPAPAVDPLKPAPQVPEVSQEKPSEVPKQPSPISQFRGDFCGVCEDNGGTCNPRTESGKAHMTLCLETLRVQSLQGFGDRLFKLESQLGNIPRMLDSLVVVVEKLADRPVYRGGSGQRKELPRERHVDGGVSWFWNEAKTYEKALDVENKDSKEFVALKTMLTDAATAGKKGLVVGAYWCFLDSFKKDGLLRKKAQDFSNSGGASK